MRKRYADAGSVKRPEAVDPQNGEVADCKESEEEKKELLTLKAGGKKRERQRHDRHHPGIAGNNESHEGDRFVEAMSGSSPTGRNSEVLKTKAANARPITGIQARKPV